MNLKQAYLKSIELGAINGLLFGSLLEITLRSMFLYSTYVQEQTPPPRDLIFEMSPYPFNWWFLPVLSLAYMTLASFIVHRYLSRHIRSSVVLWQAIAFVAVLASFLYAFIVNWYYWYFSRFDFLGIDELVRAIGRDTSDLLRVVPFLLIFNLCFALIIRYRKVELP